MAVDDLTTFAKRYRQEAAAALVTVMRDDTAPAPSRVSASVKILEYADGRPGQARPVSAASLKDLTPDQRYELFQALIRCYPEDINLEALIQHVVDQMIEQTKPKLEFRRRNRNLPLPSPAHIQNTPASGREIDQMGPEGISARLADPAAASAPAPPPYADPPTARAVTELDDQNRRSTRLAELAAPYLATGKAKRATLAADSGDGMAHALALSRLSADQLQDRFSRFRHTSDTDPTLWRGRK